MTYKEILEKVIQDENYYNNLKTIYFNNAISLEDAVHWLEQSQFINDFTEINGKDYMSFICNLANKGYNRKAIAEELVKVLN